ncbi:hypothetical protein P8452_10480 [Trifolium repens]|nr:hypothetical protein P8452_10480 [Trifolium repens]
MQTPPPLSHHLTSNIDHNTTSAPPITTTTPSNLITMEVTPNHSETETTYRRQTETAGGKQTTDADAGRIPAKIPNPS